MNQLNYHALEYILENCVSGNIDMHEPLEVTNRLKNQKTEVPLLKHLLLLCRSDKKSLISILSILKYRIRNHLLELLDDNAFIRQYVQNVIHEWNLDIAPVDLFKDGLDQFDMDADEDIFDYSNYITEKKCAQEGGARITIIEQGLRDRQESFNHMTDEYAAMVQGKVKDLHSECYECMTRIKHHTADTMEKCKMIDPYHKDVLIDLSSKSKSTYLEFSNKAKGVLDDEEDGLDESVFATFLNDKHDLEIPDTIHTIFLNYLVTLNMVKKEMNYISNALKGLLADIQPKVLTLTQLMNGLNEIDIVGISGEPLGPAVTDELTNSLLTRELGQPKEDEGITLDFLGNLKTKVAGLSFFD